MPSEIPGFTPEEIAALHRTEAATRRANADPLPGPLDSAFPAGSLKLHGFTFRKGKAGDFILAKRLNSPLFRQAIALAEHRRKITIGELPADAPPPQTEFSEEESAEIIFQFVVPIQTAREALAGGRDYYRATALATVADHVSMDVFADLVAAAVECYTASFLTAVEYEAAQADGETTINFRPQPQANATASAGGGVTSPPSAPATRGASIT